MDAREPANRRCPPAARRRPAAAAAPAKPCLPSWLRLQSGLTLALPTREGAEMELTECGPSCACFGGCDLGFSSGGGARYPPVTLRERPWKGWGVWADKLLPAGAVLCHYAGEYISNAEAQRRLAEYDAAGGGHALLVRARCRPAGATPATARLLPLLMLGCFSLSASCSNLACPPRPPNCRCCVSGCPAAPLWCGSTSTPRTAATWHAFSTTPAMAATCSCCWAGEAWLATACAAAPLHAESYSGGLPLAAPCRHLSWPTLKTRAPCLAAGALARCCQGWCL